MSNAEGMGSCENENRRFKLLGKTYESSGREYDLLFKLLTRQIFKEFNRK